MALAKWHKIDFHTHTPESRCFHDKSITPQQWLDAAKGAGLDAVVITDHNSVGYLSKIDPFRKEYEKKGLKVFYGIELCVSAEFTHILVIFDDKLSVVQIEDAVIASLGLKRDKWTDTTINVSEDCLKALCQDLAGHIMVIPAHFACEKGLGRASQNAIKKYQEFVSFDAVEVRTENDIREYENKRNNGFINKVAMITGSDNPSDRDPAIHSIEGFGKAFTWVKMSALTFEGLKQVFIDYDNRCLNMIDVMKLGVEFNPNEVTYNYISGLSIQNISHMTNMSMRFSPGLNCIVGGRGTGKSTIVESMKYGLTKSADLSLCKVLDKTLQKDGVITTYFNFGTNNPYKIDAKRTKAKSKNLEYIYEDESGLVEMPPEFKIDFYGQKEIFGLIDEDDSINAETSPLVKMIDDLLGTKIYTYKDEISNSIAELIRLSNEYKMKKKRVVEIPVLKAEIAKSQSILDRFQASGLEQARTNYESIDSSIKITQKNLMGYVAHLNMLVEGVQSKRDDYGLTLARLSDDFLQNSEAIAVINRLLESTDRVIDMLLEETKEIENDVASFEQSSMFAKKEELHGIYLERLSDLDNAGIENIKEIQDSLQDHKSRLVELQELEEELPKLVTQIKTEIDVFVKNRIELSNLRMQKINSMSMNGIFISVDSLSHEVRWKNALQKEFGRDSFENEFIQLANLVLDPGCDYENYRKFLVFILTSDDGDISSVFNNISNGKFINIWMEKAKSDTLSSVINVIPEDKINIKIVENGNEIDINEGSPGQKCAAILAFILNSGENPLIIDQPEDDLDNSLIYSLVVRSIREMKKKRQIIIVTHNPNIPVLGDAEGIIILERNSEGKVSFRKDKKAGCIEEIEIRKGICEIMEGGPDAFRKREKKYMYV